MVSSKTQLIFQQQRWGNSWHLATPPLLSLRNDDVWITSANFHTDEIWKANVISMEFLRVLSWGNQSRRREMSVVFSSYSKGLICWCTSVIKGPLTWYLRPNAFNLGSFENEALENEDRSTKHEAPKTRKRSTLYRKRRLQNLGNEAPKTRKRSTLSRKRSTLDRKRRPQNLENEAQVWAFSVFWSRPKHSLPPGLPRSGGNAFTTWVDLNCIWFVIEYLLPRLISAVFTLVSCL